MYVIGVYINYNVLGTAKLENKILLVGAVFPMMKLRHVSANLLFLMCEFSIIRKMSRSLLIKGWCGPERLHCDFPFFIDNCLSNQCKHHTNTLTEIFV